MIALRPYQLAQIAAVEREHTRVRATLLIAATGTGKTTTFVALIRQWRAAGRSLVVAHREELIAQAVDRIRAMTDLTVGIEMGEQRASLDADVVVATVQTLQHPRRRERFPADHFARIVVDEAHHGPAASYRAVLDYFGAAKILGVTATPDRGDEAGLRSVFESVAHVYDIRDAIRDGWLCPVRQRAVMIEGLDLSRVRTTAGDLNDGDLGRALLADKVIQGIASAIVTEAGDRPTIAFTPTVAVAYALAAALHAYEPGSARACDGTTDRDERRQAIADFAAGKFTRLVNCSLWTEGFDAPRIACVAVVRPTKSRAFYAQMIGRGTRILDGKRDLLALDFHGNAGRHRLVTPADILGSDELPEVRERAATKLDMDTLQAIEEARREIREERRLGTLAQARYRAVDIDPFGLAEAVLAIPVSRRAAPDEPPEVQIARMSFLPVDRQREWVAARTPGLHVEALEPADLERIALQLRVDEAARRATWSQRRCLQRAGIDCDGIGAKAAAVAIEILARSGWRASAALRHALILPANGPRLHALRSLLDGGASHPAVTEMQR